MENNFVHTFLRHFENGSKAQTMLESIRSDPKDWADKLRPFWAVIKPLLKLAEMFTSDKIDHIIDEVILLIDKALAKD